MFFLFSSAIVRVSAKIVPGCVLWGIFKGNHEPLTSTTNYKLCFYCQFDVKNQRIFLRRTKYDHLHPEDLFVGNRVNVFSRQLNLIDYGDQYTANKLGSKKERYGCATCLCMFLFSYTPHSCGSWYLFQHCHLHLFSSFKTWSYIIKAAIWLRLCVFDWIDEDYFMILL